MSIDDSGYRQLPRRGFLDLVLELVRHLSPILDRHILLQNLSLIVCWI